MIALRNALNACRAGEGAAMSGLTFSMNELPQPVRRAGYALLYAALAHVLNKPKGAFPKTLQWGGRRWYLADLGRGQLQVSAAPDLPGIVSMHGALI